jgi:hypothetical protein
LYEEIIGGKEKISRLKGDGLTERGVKGGK